MPSIPLSLLALVEAVAGDACHAKTIALFLAADAMPVSGLEKHGDVDGDDLVQLCRICADDGDDALELEPMVVATWRPGRGAAPSDDDRATWAAMLRTVAGTPVVLLDWLLIDGDHACSMATGCRWTTR